MAKPQFSQFITKGGVIMHRLKELREDSDIKQETLATYLHIKQNTYSQYENGQRQLPVEILIELAKFYNVSTDYILGLTNEAKPYKSGEK